MRTRFNRLTPAVLCVSLALCGTALTASAVGPTAAAQLPEPPTDGLVAWYKLDETAGTVAADSSGNGRHGTVVGTPSWQGAQGLAFNGSGTFVDLPDNLMRGLGAITVSMDVLVDTTQATPFFIYGFGNSSGANGNGYLFTTGNHYRTAIASGNWSTEQNTRLSTSHNLARGAWKHIAYTLSGGVGVLYEDGVEIGRNPAITLTPGGIGGGTTTANYIGRSLYSGDRYFKGRIRDFRVYDHALDGDEIERAAAEVTEEIVATDTAGLDLGLGDTGEVLGDLALPATGGRGSAISWSSSNEAVVAADGAVIRPPVGAPDVDVTLTATVSRGASQQVRTFEVTVLAEFDDQRATEHAAGRLMVHNVDDVRGHLTLPTDGDHGTTVTWTSSHPAVISTTGEVHRPANGAGGVTVELTAHVRRGEATTTRTFPAGVPELPRAEPYEGYLFSYFTGEGTATGEQVYFGASLGNDPLHWQELNEGQPVLTSTLGEQGLRDPFIIRSPEGDKFYQIATDLRIFGNGNWDAAQRRGSRSIMVWESTDLVNWTDQRLVEVSPPTAGNTWAPEAYYDPGLGAYVVFWASKIYAESDPGHTGNTHNRMMYTTTRDFYTFSEPQVWIDPGHSVIDSTVVEHDGTFYRYTKDERNRGSSSPCGKFIVAEKSDSVLDLDWDFIAECIGQGSIGQGEGPTIFKSNTEEKWYLFIDEFGGRGYVPFESTDLDSGSWTLSTGYQLPARPRHGTVLPVTRAEHTRLLERYGPCPGGVTPDQSIAFGAADSGVANYDRGDGCTFLDELSEAGPFDDHGAFVREVRALVKQWRADGLLTRQEAQDVEVAANRSDIGRG